VVDVAVAHPTPCQGRISGILVKKSSSIKIYYKRSGCKMLKFDEKGKSN
jgi:hypothetical protein